MSNVSVSKFEGQWQVKVDGRVVGKLDSQTAQTVEHQLLNNRLNAEGVPAGHVRVPAGSKSTEKKSRGK